MKYEKSCGAVVFTRINNEITYLLIQNLGGTYGFPKRHVEQGETEEQTALREIFEEVGLRVELYPDFRREDEYFIHEKASTLKKVVYFLGEYSNQEFTYQKEELAGARLFSYKSALEVLPFESTKRILIEANDFLLGL